MTGYPGSEEVITPRTHVVYTAGGCGGKVQLGRCSCFVRVDRHVYLGSGEDRELRRASQITTMSASYAVKGLLG